MTVASATARSGPYAGNGSTTVFAYTFRILDQTHLRVVLTNAAGVETVLALTTHYSVSGVGSSGGGSITMVTAPATGETLTVVRDVPFTQETDYQNQGAYYAETVEDAIDLLTMTDQQLAESIGRSVTLPVASTITDLTLPMPTASTLIGWNASADALANYVPNTAAYLVAALADVTMAEAQQITNIDTATFSVAQWAGLAALTEAELQQLANIDTATFSVAQWAGLAALTEAELQQLATIGATTISAAQWGYLGGSTAIGGSLLTAVDAAAARTALAASGRVLIATSGAIVGSGVASVDFTSTHITSDFDAYEIDISGLLPATDGATLYLRVSTDGGSTYISTASYDWRLQAYGTSDASAHFSGDTEIRISPGGIGNNTGEAYGATIKIYDPMNNATSIDCIISGHGLSTNNSGARFSFVVGGSYNVNTAVNGLQIITATGNILRGIINLYGMGR